MADGSIGVSVLSCSGGDGQRPAETGRCLKGRHPEAKAALSQKEGSLTVQVSSGVGEVLRFGALPPFLELRCVIGGETQNDVHCGSP